MRNKPVVNLQDAISLSSWSSFKPIPGGSSREIRKSVAETKNQVAVESKIFTSSAILNGGTKIQTK